MTNDTPAAVAGAPPPGRVRRTADPVIDPPPIVTARPSPAAPRRRSRRRAIEWSLWLAGALAVAVVVRAVLFQAFWIPSESMLPTLAKGDRVIVNKLSYRVHDVARGDIVVFDNPGPDGAAHLVKRVVGLSGETIEGIDGDIYIDGRRLDEPYLPDGTDSRIFGPIEVPADTVFVLGDNRLHSDDSTHIGPIPVDRIVGRVVLRFWPPGRLGLL